MAAGRAYLLMVATAAAVSPAGTAVKSSFAAESAGLSASPSPFALGAAVDIESIPCSYTPEECPDVSWDLTPLQQFTTSTEGDLQARL